MVAVELVGYERSQLCTIGEGLKYADPPKREFSTRFGFAEIVERRTA